MKRRTFLKAAAIAPAVLRASMPRPTDVRIEGVAVTYEDFVYRVPIKFGGTVVDRATILNVLCAVRTKDGKLGKGFGSMPLGNVWSFPSHTMPYAQTLSAMKALAEKVKSITASHTDYAHPIDIFFALEPQYLKAAKEVSAELHLTEPIPKLCALVTASAFDGAIHDAFGKAHGLNCYHTYGADFMTHDLAHYAGPGFEGAYPDRFIQKEPKQRLPLYHLVSAVDPIEDKDIVKRVNDGLPETLPEWIRYNGLTHLKIKLNGDDVAWDTNRVLTVDRVTRETQKTRGVSDYVYSLDFNEKCPSIDALLSFIHNIKEKQPDCFRRIQYIEQPFSRDMTAHRQSVAAASRLIPVVIDEALTGIDALLLAKELGYTGAALKACKGQSNTIIEAPVAEHSKMFLCVQDLTCPGASLIQSAGIASHVTGVRACEANARQYMPAANKKWEGRFPGLFHIHDGMMDTGLLNRPGLGAV